MLLLLIHVIMGVTVCERICTAPNGTDTHLVWKSCSDGPIIFHNLTLLDENRKFFPFCNAMYPIDAKKPFIVSGSITNTANEYYGDLATSVKLYKWGGLFGCHWYQIPSFGVLDDLVECGKGIECPIRPGPQQLTMTFNLRGIDYFIKILPDGVPYKMIFEIMDLAKDTYSCIEMWSVIRT
ncbi:unnamed protein product [Thelazia callipaeda]|uniref:ML domain-containing protein n=1 Tax=Thelazia callipaeda TaxID=103827 RepID=A0A0N5D2C9_THECL|nr:unnamed protein product [Thelazia callipaeda]